MPNNGLEINKRVAIVGIGPWLRHRGARVSLRSAHRTNARGLLLWLVKAAGLYRAIAILTLNMVLFLVTLDLAATAAVKLHGFVSRPASEPLIGEGNPRETVSYYSSQPWARRYWQEFRLSRKQRYYPYVGWRRAPFEGETINVGRNGIRETPGADCRDGAFKVFAFGESSMWGTGSPDWGTIPANLQKRLEEVGPGPVCVVNFAESAYVSTQDLLMLLMQLQAGNRPDLVLFYNTGDIYAAYQSGRAGVIQNLDQLAAKFQSGPNQPTLLDRLRNTSSYALTARLVENITLKNSEQTNAAPKQLVTYKTMGIDSKELSDSVVQNYLQTYRIVNALGEKYGFKALFFLPPHISLGNKHLTEEERQIEAEEEEDSDPALAELFTSIYQGLESRSVQNQNIYSLANVFDNIDGLMWIDGGHTTPVGNQVIAGRILEIIQPSKQ